ncbi:MAG: DoxX family protein [Acidiferrobacterales bacterium]|nr:DoxX family protein [Acidiferrobacterales bacterium]
MNSTANDQGAMLLRIGLGAVLLAHGLLKVLVFTVAGTVGFFESLGLSAVIAYLTIFGEVVGGAALILGIYPRLVAVLSLPILLGAAWVHSGNGWLFSNEGGGWEFPALLVLIAIVVAIQGGGRFAIKRIPIVDTLIPAFLKA